MMSLSYTMAILSAAGPYMPTIEQESRKHELDPLLVVAVIWHESRFHVRACYRGAHGLMQIQVRSRSCKRSAGFAGRKGLYDPDKNIRRGVELLAWWKSWWKKHPRRKRYHWLLHYNQGFGVCPGGCKKCSPSRRTPIRTGRIGRYARTVLRTYGKLKAMLRV